ncbi:MAG: hypothetical protein J5552_04145 [Prevotella sp.]|nr:hypothetical protein [Prevotella sp.]
MKRIAMAFALLLVLAGCGQKNDNSKERNDATEEAEERVMEADDESVASSNEVEAFDFERYHEAMLEQAFPRYAKSAEDVRFVEYALIDIDGDGRPEVWVRGDEGQDYQGVFAIAGDSAILLADADVRSEIMLYKNAVGYDGYYGDGKVMSGATVVKNSRPAESYYEDYQFNIFSEEQETLDETYYLNGKLSTAEECKAFREQLGDTIAAPALQWHPVKSIERTEEE